MSALSRFGGTREPHFDIKVQEESALKLKKSGSMPQFSENSEMLLRQRELAKASSPKPAQTRDFSVALQMLELATSGVDTLSAKLRQSDAERDDLIEQIEHYKTIEKQWNADMNSAKARFTEMEMEMSSLSERLINETSRSTNLQAKLTELEEALKNSEERYTELESDCTALHDSILDAFGVGSKAYKTLSSTG